MLKSALQIIANPAAASGRSQKTIRQIQKYLKQHHYAYHLHLTSPQGAQALTRKIINAGTSTDASSKIIIVGGDGTLNQALNGLRQSLNPRLPLGYLPAGSGNDFANALGLKRYKITQLLEEMIQVSTPVWLNLGHVTGLAQSKFFINNFGMGLDAQIIKGVTQSSVKTVFNHLHLSKLIYLSQVYFALKQPRFRVELSFADQQKHFENIFLCMVANQPYIGGGVRLVPPESIQARSLRIVIADQLPFTELIKIIIKIFTDGSHLASPFVHTYELHDFSVHAVPAQIAQMDGELITPPQEKLNFTSTPQAFWLPKTYLKSLPD